MIRRQDIELLDTKYGLKFNHTGEILSHFENLIADYFGAPCAVVTDCCSHALELVLRITQPRHTATIPLNTYMSVPMTLHKLGIPYQFHRVAWQDYYNVIDNVFDAATLWRANSYVKNTFMTLSFQYKKHLPIGRGGMILLDDASLAEKLRLMAHDGRDRNQDQWNANVTEVGYHYYMTPEDAARGIDLFYQVKDQPATIWNSDDYRSLDSFDVFKQVKII